MNFIEKDDVIIGFRPEAFLPSEMIDDKYVMRLRFRVERTENLGSFKLVYGRIGEDKVIANLSPRSPLAEGEECDFSVRSQDVRYFDRKDGVRLKR